MINPGFIREIAQAGTVAFNSCLLLFTQLSPVLSQAEIEIEKVDIGTKTDFFFIHHSCGGMSLANVGHRTGGESGVGNWCIFRANPNGEVLGPKLESKGYQINK